jgi:hypothetical protein
VDQEIQFLLAEKSDKFTLRHVTIFKQILDSHEESRRNVSILTNDGKKVTMAAIEYDELQLLLKRCEKDLDSLAAWRQNCQGIEQIAYCSIQRFALRQEDNAIAAAEMLLKRKVMFLVWDTDDREAANLNRAMNARRDFQRTHMLEREPPMVTEEEQQMPTQPPQIQFGIHNCCPKVKAPNLEAFRKA